MPCLRMSDNDSMCLQFDLFEMASPLQGSIKRLTRSALPLIPMLLLFVSQLNAEDRIVEGLRVLYDFQEGEGKTVHDRSGFGEPLDLTIDDMKRVKWGSGSLIVNSATTISSSSPATKIIDSARKTNALTIEAWIRPANANQTGPARIASISTSPTQRNVTLGQDGNRYDIRLRTTERDNNGLPSISTSESSVSLRPSHVVFTRDRGGRASIYIDGKRVSHAVSGGQFRNWDMGHELILGNEATGDRPWLGQLYLVAIYSRALTVNEVEKNFAAGPMSKSVRSANQTKDPSSMLASKSRHFESEIAPLFVKHCLECHDSAVKLGRFNLSNKAAAFAGGESGKVIVPGKADQSLLWEWVESNEMPKDRPPLLEAEKKLLREWIEAGAVWSIDVIDPANYLYEGGQNQIWVQRLTVPEYVETVKSTVGVDIGREARQILPPDLRADGFSNTAYNLNVDLKHIEAYGQLAEIIVDRMNLREFTDRFSKKRKLSTDASMRDDVAAIGKWILRGPLTQDEVNAYSGITTTVASAGGDYDDAMKYLIETLLQSPRFLYRVEDQIGDGYERPVSLHELASRMSYIVWGASPDRDLMRAADQGDLADPEQVARHVKRMLDDPRAIKRSLEFVSQWLDLDRLTNLMPNERRYPQWDAELAADMREETLAFFEEVAWKQNRPLADLLNAPFTFVSPKLAKHYGFKVHDSGRMKYDLTNIPERGGLLTQGSVLTIGGDQASMVARGLFVLHDLLRGNVNAPPPCVDTTPPPTKLGLTMRGIAEVRIADQNCGVCHARFEPLAFGLEKYDGIGAFQDHDQFGNELRDDGEVLFPGDERPVPYQNSAELMNLLAESERVRQSLTWKLTQFSLGRPIFPADARTVASIHQRATERGGTYADLISAIVMSDLVQNTRTEE